MVSHAKAGFDTWVSRSATQDGNGTSEETKTFISSRETMVVTSIPDEPGDFRRVRLPTVSI